MNRSTRSTDPDENSTSEKLTFLTLPPEIRTFVYSHLFQNVVLRPMYDDEKQLDLTTSDLSILLVSRLCHHEAEPILWTKTRLILLNGPRYNDIGTTLAAKVQRTNLAKCTELEMPFDMVPRWTPERVQGLFPNLKTLTFGWLCIPAPPNIYRNSCDETGKLNRNDLEKQYRLVFLDYLPLYRFQEVVDHCVDFVKYRTKVSIRGTPRASPRSGLSVQATFYLEDGTLDQGKWDWEDTTCFSENI